MSGSFHPSGNERGESIDTRSGRAATVSLKSSSSVLKLLVTLAHVRSFRGKEHFLQYCGRYFRRPPIAQWRIIAIENGLVKFWHKDKRRKRWITVECTIEVFIDRWSQHIPKLYRHTVRHFGLFAPRRWPRVAAAIFTILGTKQRPRPKRLPWAVAVQKFRGNPLLDRYSQPMKFVRHLAASAV